MANVIKSHHHHQLQEQQIGTEPKAGFKGLAPMGGTGVASQYVEQWLNEILALSKEDINQMKILKRAE